MQDNCLNFSALDQSFDANLLPGWRVLQQQGGGGGGVPSPLSAFSLGRCGLWVLEDLIREKLTMTHHDIVLTHSVATNTCVSAERVRSLVGAQS